MKIYTKTGDAGTTGVIGGRLAKDHPRVEACGALDELNACVGLARANFTAAKDADIIRDLSAIQQALCDGCVDLATLNPEIQAYRLTGVHVAEVETRIDHYTRETAALDDFILPGGRPAAAMLHLCRTVCRRAERRIVTLARQAPPLNGEVLRYVNRLSDLFFVLARVCNARAGVADVPYTRRQPVSKRD